jgi:subtilisin family serine protease
MLYWGMGAEWADSLGAEIISSSLGYFTFDDSQYNYTYADMDGHTTDVTRAAEIAASKGLLVVNAVGNEGGSPWRHLIAPADADSVLAVGAVSLAGDTAAFSSVGPSAGSNPRIKPDVVARGVSNPVVSAFGQPMSYATGSGTSFSAPIVAGLAACLMQANAAASPQQILEAIRSTASRAGHPDNKMGYGIPDALAALEMLGGSGPRPGAEEFLALSFTGSNPLRSSDPPAVIHFELAERSASPSEARLGVMDLEGRIVRDLWSGALCSGQRQTIAWDGRDGDGDAVAPGVYWIALRSGGHVKAVRIVSLR